MQEVRLVVESGKNRSRTFQVRAEETVIGRRQDCDLRIASSEVSRRHCLVSVQDGFVKVEDLDSVNGTFINGKRIHGKQVLRPGDRLELGPVRFVVEYELTQEALDRLEAVESEIGAGDEEVMEVVPLAEGEGAEVSDGEDDALEAVPLDDEETELATVEPLDDEAEEAIPLDDDVEEAVPVDEDEAPIPVEDSTRDAKWQMPETHELRNLLSEIDPEKPQGPRRQKQ